MLFFVLHLLQRKRFFQHDKEKFLHFFCAIPFIKPETLAGSGLYKFYHAVFPGNKFSTCLRYTNKSIAEDTHTAIAM